MFTNKILEKFLSSVVTVHVLVAFHQQHFALTPMTENNAVGVALKSIQVNNSDVQISAITNHQKKIQTNHHVLLATLLGRYINNKTRYKRKEAPKLPQPFFSEKHSCLIPVFVRTLIKETLMPRSKKFKFCCPKPPKSCQNSTSTRLNAC